MANGEIKRDSFYKTVKILPSASTTITLPTYGCYSLCTYNGQTYSSGAYLIYMRGNANTQIVALKETTGVTMSASGMNITITNTSDTFDIRIGVRENLLIFI